MDDKSHSIDWYVGYFHKMNEELEKTSRSYDALIARIYENIRYNKITVNIMLVVGIALILVLLLQLLLR